MKKGRGGEWKKKSEKRSWSLATNCHRWRRYVTGGETVLGEGVLEREERTRKDESEKDFEKKKWHKLITDVLTYSKQACMHFIFLPDEQPLIRS